MKSGFVALATACAVVVLTVAGCGKLDDSDIVAEVGKEKVTADVANFYARYQQAQYETNYAGLLGNDMWSEEDEKGQTYEESMKESILDSLEKLYVLDLHKEDYGVSLNKDEKQAIDKATEEFLKANSPENKAVVSGNEKSVKKVLTLLTVQEKMRDLVTADVDTQVSDEEAAQKSMQYVYFSFNKEGDDGKSAPLTDKEKTELRKEADEFQKGALEAEDFEAYAKEKGYTVSNQTFDAETTSPSGALIAAAETVKEGQVTEVVEDPSGYFVGKVTSLLDRTATDRKKESMAAEKKQKAFHDQIEKWLDEEKVTVHKEVWEKIDFEKQGVTLKKTGTEQDK